MPENERNREETPPQKPMPPESRPPDVPVPGSAVRNLAARELPGEPLFHMAGGLTGFTLQGPRSLDVAPEAILAKLLEELRPGALFHVQKGTTELIRTASGDALESVEVRDGLIRARGKGDPPSEGLESLKPARCSGRPGRVETWRTASFIRKG